MPVSTRATRSFCFALVIALLASPVAAQRVPEVGYVFPAGGRAGATIEVRLGGFDWTPDMDYFTLDPRVKLSADGPPGPILIPPPPYWFGPKGRLPALPLPREVAARFVIPSDMPPGPIRWQAANANGGTSTGVFVVGAGEEIVENEKLHALQAIAALPATVSGRIIKNEEIDRYQFTLPKAGLVTCELASRRLGSGLQGAIEVRDSAGNVLAEAVDTEGLDATLSFFARTAGEYQIAVRDIDHGGDRSYVYRLAITPGPRVLAALPAGGRRGETREIEFVGIGLATGADKLETVKAAVPFPSDPSVSSLTYVLQTSTGASPAFSLLIGDLDETVEPAATGLSPYKLATPIAITGRLDGQTPVDRYAFDAKAGERVAISLDARRIGSPLDVSLSVRGADGKELAANDDLPGTTDSGLEFAAPADGTYELVVSDVSGRAPSLASVYRLSLSQPIADFAIEIPQRLNVLLSGPMSPTNLTVKAVRLGGWTGSIKLSIAGLPAGMQATGDLVIAADKNELSVPIAAAADAVAAASLASVTGEGQIDGVATIRRAYAVATGNLAPLCPEENHAAQMLVAGVMKPRCKGRPVDQDTVRKARRGATFPADVIVERLEGFAGPITLKMSSKQSYQVQGITGGEVVVPPGVTQAVYPCFMPEWLETIRTSRMAMVSVVEVPDSQGRVRHLVNDITGMVTMTLEGAILTLSHPKGELRAALGGAFDVHLKVARAVQLPEPVKLELRLPEELEGLLAAEPLVVPPGQAEADFRITVAADPRLGGWQSFAIRATALPKPDLPVISETRIEVEFLPAGSAAAGQTAGSSQPPGKQPR